MLLVKLSDNDPYWKWLLKLVDPITFLPPPLMINNIPMFSVPPLFVVEFLHRVVDTFEDYFSECTESIIKEHYVVVYEVIIIIMSLNYIQSWGEKR